MSYEDVIIERRFDRRKGQQVGVNADQILVGLLSLTGALKMEVLEPLTYLLLDERHIDGDDLGFTGANGRSVGSETLRDALAYATYNGLVRLNGPLVELTPAGRDAGRSSPLLKIRGIRKKVGEFQQLGVDELRTQARTRLSEARNHISA